MRTHPPVLLDTTLRDGEQSPGLYFTSDEKILIARQLDMLGVGVIEAGIPSMGPAEQHVLAQLVRSGLAAEILSWNRLVEADIAASLACGVRHVHVSIPTSPTHIDLKLGKNRAWILDRIKRVVGPAVEQGAIISFGAEDASRTDPEFLREVFATAVESGASRVRYADTLGVLTPDRAAAVVSYLAGCLPVPIDFHGHDDFGMATANAVAAWKAGAQMVSCSLLGLGERAGNTPLEEFVGALHFIEGYYGTFDFIALKQLCEEVGKICRRPIPPQKPIIGSDIFHHESGIHVDGLLKASETYELFPPEIVGGQRKLILGKHSGRAAVRYLAGLESLTLDDEQITTFLADIRARMAREQGLDVNRIFKEFLSGRCAHKT